MEIELRDTSQTNTSRGEAVNQNWLPLATGFKMEDDIILILLLLKRKLQNLILMLNYLTFIASRYKLNVNVHILMKIKILRACNWSKTVCTVLCLQN